MPKAIVTPLPFQVGAHVEPLTVDYDAASGRFRRVRFARLQRRLGDVALVLQAAAFTALVGPNALWLQVDGRAEETGPVRRLCRSPGPPTLLAWLRPDLREPVRDVVVALAACAALGLVGGWVLSQ